MVPPPDTIPSPPRQSDTPSFVLCWFSDASHPTFDGFRTLPIPSVSPSPLLKLPAAIVHLAPPPPIIYVLFEGNNVWNRGVGGPLLTRAPKTKYLAKNTKHISPKQSAASNTWLTLPAAKAPAGLRQYPTVFNWRLCRCSWS